MMILSTSRSSSSEIRTSSSWSRAGRVVAAEQRVGDRARLLEDLLAHEPVVAVLLGGGEVPVDVVARCPRPGVPSKPITATPSRVIVTIWSWPSSSASRVCSMNAATSEPMKFSPSPMPTTSGELRRAATTRDRVLGVDRDQREGALEPRQTVPHRVGQVAAGGQGRLEQVGRDLGVGLGAQLVARAPRPRPAASAKFSMIPLCTSATRPRVARGAGGRWRRSARRGWPSGCARCRSWTPAAGSSASAFSRLASLPARLRHAMPCRRRRARCRRSRSRGTPAAAAPR